MQNTTQQTTKHIHHKYTQQGRSNTNNKRATRQNMATTTTIQKQKKTKKKKVDMKNKTCRWCKKQFTPPPNKKAIQYCSNNCRKQGYKQKQQEARKRYNQRHPTQTQPTIRKCNYCGQTFPSTHGKKYCSNNCRKQARREQTNRHVKHYYAVHGRSEKELYYANLGNSNLREHRNPSFDDEIKLIRAELRRLHI